MLGLGGVVASSGCQRSLLMPGRPGVRRGDGDYELWRQSMPWQMRKPDRYPELIVRPRDVAEVIDAVRLARSEGLRVTARSGGHHVWGSVLRNDSLLVDMSRFRDIAVDKDRGVADVGPAAWSDRLARVLAAENFAFPVAHCATVPMGGYLMGGGLGINGDEWGPLACHSVLEADIVTADGETVTASPRENEDLFWAVRGAGHGFFGVVTRYRLKLYALPRAVRVSVYVFPVSRLPEIGAWLREAVGAGLPKTEMLALLLENPDAKPDDPPEARKLCVVRPAVFADSDEEAAEILRPISSHKMAAQAFFKSELQKTSIQKLLEESIDLNRGFGFGRYAVDTLWTDSPTDALTSVAQEFLTTDSWKSHVVMTFKNRTDIPADAALSRMTDTWIGNYAVWDEAGEDDANIGWLRRASAALQPYAAGHSINEIDAAPDPGKVKRTFSPEAWRRLRQIRATRDPDNLFHDYLHIA